MLRAWQVCIDPLFSVSGLAAFVGIAKHTAVIVAELEAVSDLTASPNQPFQVVLPSSSSIAEFWPSSQQFVALPHELQRTISSHLGAIYIGFNILLSLVKRTHQQQENDSGLAVYERYEPWILDMCLKLWQHFRRWTTGADRRSFQDETVSSFLDLLEAIALRSDSIKGRVMGSAKAAQCLVRGLSNLLEKPNLSVANQVRLASLLVRLQSTLHASSKITPATARRRVNSAATIKDDLEASIAWTCQDAEKFSTLHKDLQVRLVGSSLYNKKLITSSRHYVCGLHQGHGLLRLRMRAMSFARMRLAASRILSFSRVQHQF